MKIIDPGHHYELSDLDKDYEGQVNQELIFVKRVGPNFPGNVAPSYSGTTTQEVLRALLDRIWYVDKQIPSEHNVTAARHLREALWDLEVRAAEARDEGKLFVARRTKDCREDVENIPTCPTCQHIYCGRHA